MSERKKKKNIPEKIILIPGKNKSAGDTVAKAAAELLRLKSISP